MRVKGGESLVVIAGAFLKLAEQLHSAARSQDPPGHLLERCEAFGEPLAPGGGPRRG